MKLEKKELLFVVLVVVALMMTACGTAPPETQIVTVEVPGETIIETVEVPGETIIETVEVPVEVQVEVEQYPEGTELNILQWSHFVPQYDTWIDPFAEAWGDANGVDVTVDHIALGELPAALTAAIDAGDGPSLVEMVFAPGQFVEGLHDLTDLNMKAVEMFGPQAPTCAASSYLPATDTWYGYCPGWIPDPANYVRDKWEAVGFPNGPTTWDDLLVGGTAIKDQFGLPLGLGMSPELDSRLAMRAIIWSHGGSVQDENECVVLNSPETIEAVNFAADLYQNTMTEEVFAWTPASNNQGLIAGELSYILNSISAYRSTQDIDPEAADNIGFGPALIGPRGDQHASAHVWQIYVIPNYVEGAELEAAEAYLLHLTANYNQAVFNSKLYNFPAFDSTVPQLPGWLDADPFGSRPADKLNVLNTAKDWVTYLGFPGPSSPAIGEVFGSNVIVTMMAQVALGEKTAEESVADAEAQIEEIFDKWRDLGLVGCTE
jgi:multiple sugar transport system substrate-binding protein